MILHFLMLLVFILTMAGIIFFTTNNLKSIVAFYKGTIGFQIWLTQTNIEILKHENLLIGFHETGVGEAGGLITIFYKSKSEVDEMYKILHRLKQAKSPPKINTKYNIYNFFATDPEGRKLEFQSFLHKIPNY